MRKKAERRRRAMRERRKARKSKIMQHRGLGACGASIETCLSGVSNCCRKMRSRAGWRGATVAHRWVLYPNRMRGGSWRRVRRWLCCPSDLAGTAGRPLLACLIPRGAFPNAAPIGARVVSLLNTLWDRVRRPDRPRVHKRGGCGSRSFRRLAFCDCSSVFALRTLYFFLRLSLANIPRKLGAASGRVHPTRARDGTRALS